MLLISFPVAVIVSIVETLEEIAPSRKYDWWSGDKSLLGSASAMDFIIGDGSVAGESSKTGKKVESAVNPFMIGIQYLEKFNAGKRMMQYDGCCWRFRATFASSAKTSKTFHLFVLRRDQTPYRER